ncbi:YbhB/YbcL family Raf kinase inhibitor-like protein [Thermosipho ferrireducens]|uniref:YbhB/YbcL family Raf kinase inhibitor-like protein n=1 Tax=Thermosipho ferrireducens TaxID=2571116 RepID=A0ABX7S920_9BACT|nr:YbhB/YbcL family Raf kinase inhibitor-like protein [Thermosipho ferrireducens]QTA38376.1 YbhB/YbcL family Raf kinase inhibitor-like protein [Thermosipho ferrireducens]
MTVQTIFKNGDKIPKRYTCEGVDVNPELKIEDIPSNTKSLAIIVDDPDAPFGTFVHWVVWNITPNTDAIKIPENFLGGIQGKNDFGNNAYNGPCPPRGHGVHHYHFKIYALNTVLKIPASSGKKELEKAMNGHIIDSAKIVGIYRR